MMTREMRTELYDALDGRYVTRTECGARVRETRAKLHNDDKRLAVIEFQQKVNNWLTAAIAAGIIALVIKTFLGG